MRMTFPEGAASWVRRALSFLGIFLGATLLLYVTDIGCIIRTVTGVPCPGCGMTRAWLAFLTGHFDAALAYHPLFWCVPVVFAVPVVQELFPGARRPRALTMTSSICSVPYGLGCCHNKGFVGLLAARCRPATLR